MQVHFIRPYFEAIRTQITESLASAGLSVGRVFGPDEPLSALVLWLDRHEQDALCIPYNPGTGGSGVDVVAHVLAKHPRMRILMPVRECSAESVVDELAERLRTIEVAEPTNVLPMRIERILSPEGVRAIHDHFGLN